MEQREAELWVALRLMEEKVQEEESVVAWCLKQELEQVQGQELALERECGWEQAQEQVRGQGQGGGSTEEAHLQVLQDV